MLEGARHNGQPTGPKRLVNPMTKDPLHAQGDRRGSGSLRLVAVAISGVGAVALVAAAFRMSGGGTAFLLVTPFILWGLTPFALALFSLRGRRVRTARALGMVATSAFGLAIYGDLYLATRQSSTAGLAFLFIPFWQLLACGAVLITTNRGRSDEAA